MKLKKLNIKQFRGVKDFECCFGEINKICGENGIGKTTILDSIMWLLCDETFTYGKANDDNKNKDSHKDVIEVTGQFVKEDGSELNLKRTYFEKWNVTDDEETFDRVINKFEINGANYKLNEYLDRIRAEIGIKYDTKVKGVNLLRMIIDYSYFGTLDYKISRKFIEEILGVVNDKEILNSEEFNLIKDYVLAQNGDDVKVRSTFKNNFEKASISCETLENQIEANNKLINNDEINKYDNLIKEKNDLIETTIASDSEYNVLNQSLQEKGINIQQHEENSNKAIFEERNVNNELVKQGKEIVAKINDLKSKNSLLDSNLKSAENFVNYIENSINDIKQEICKKNKETFNIVECPKCNYILNENSKQEWEAKKQEELKELNQKEEEANSKINYQQKIIETCKENITKNNQEISNLEKDLDELRKSYEKSNNKIAKLVLDTEKDEELLKLKQELQELEIKINDYTITYNNNKQNKLLELQSKITNCENSKKLLEQNQKLIEEAKIQKRNKAIAELQLELLEKFKNQKIQMTKENTKRVFPNIDFELLYISPTTNSLTNCCYAKQGNVEFNGVNSGNRYLLGIEVIEDIKRALNVSESLPLLFDKFADLDSNNFKKCLELTNAQIISTYVNDENKISIEKGSR